MKKQIKKKLFFFVLNLFIVSMLILNFLSNNLMPIFISYGKYQCNNISTKLINYVITEYMTEQIKDEIVINSDNEKISLDFNTSILNSIVSSSIKKIHYYFYQMERGNLTEEISQKIGINLSQDKKNKGVIYEIPFSRAFNNIFIANLGINIPVRYQLTGEITGQIVSNLKEYGINNALLEINLEISSKTMIIVPLLSEEETLKVSIPLVMKLIQGEIPEFFLGTNILGGTN